MIYFLADASGYEKRWGNAQCATLKLMLRLMEILGKSSMRNIKTYGLGYEKNATSKLAQSCLVFRLVRGKCRCPTSCVAQLMQSVVSYANRRGPTAKVAPSQAGPMFQPCPNLVALDKQPVTQ